MKARTLWISGLVLFCLLSLADLYLTRLVIMQSGRIQEGNPIAGAWLLKYGWSGLVVFKVAAMTVVVVVVILISRRHPATAAGLVLFCCLIMGMVTLYSRHLLLHLPPEPVEVDD